MTKTAFGQTTTYDDDALGNLLTVTLPSASVISYVIDRRNRRVGKIVDGTLQRGWLYGDQLRPIAELGADGSVVARFVYGLWPNVPDYMMKGGVNYRFVFGDPINTIDAFGFLVAPGWAGVPRLVARSSRS